NGAMKDLGTFGGPTSGVGGINDSGLVVGGATTSSGASHAFLYRNGTMLDLNSLVISPSPFWGLQGAVAISNNGYIAAQAGDTAYLLTPVQPGDANGDGPVDLNDLTIVLTNFGTTFGTSLAPAPSAVPEPSALALLLALALLVALCF